MFGSRGWQRFALVLNLFGTLLLFVSFQATSSNVRIVRTRDGSMTALCVESEAIFVTEKRGVGIGANCPSITDGRPVAIVNIEKPALVGFGFIMILIGFALQIISVPDAKTIDDMRRQLKELKTKKSYGKRH